MQCKGQEPTENDVSYFGLYHAVQSTTSEFSLYKDGEYAARGRVGTSPLYWNRGLGLFSFKPGPELVEFPPGHLYNFAQDRLICWDPMYFDRPAKTLKCASVDVRMLLNIAVNKHHADAFLMSFGRGSRIIDEYINPTIPAYTVGFENSIDVENSRGITLYIDETTQYPKYLSDNEKPMYALARYISTHTNHKKLICGLGCTELFRDSYDFRPNVNHVVDQFAKFDLEIWSPFFDLTLMEYVLDTTDPEDREMILAEIVDEFDHDGLEIYETTGVPENKKSMLSVIHEAVQRWYFKDA